MHDQSLERMDNESQLKDLLRTEVLRNFDRDSFERNGYWVWEGILTDAGRKNLTATLQHVQKKSDDMVMNTNWAAIDFAGRGLAPLEPTKITSEFLSTCIGGKRLGLFISEELRKYMHEHGLFGPGPELVTQGFKSQGFMPEWFPAGYDNFLLDMISGHTQMMELFSKLLGRRFVLDHCMMLNRPPGRSFSGWHGHPYAQGQFEVQDAIGNGEAVSTEFLEQQVVRTLCYPEGTAANDGGELAVIPGAHLYRIPYKWDTSRPDDDPAMESGWLKGKTHPITGRPLEILHLWLPPGSMVSFVHHMPHYVGPRRPGSGVRWALLMAYRTPNFETHSAKWTEAVPPHWIERMAAEGKLSPTAQHVFAGDNPLTDAALL